MTERWLPVPGWEGFYEVSDHGRVRSLARLSANGKRLQQKVLKPGRGKVMEHRHVILCRDRKRKMCFVHRAVLEAFVGPAPEGLQACHGDGDPTNNHLSNLRWGTPTENMQDRIAHGNNPQINKVTCPRGHLLQSPNLVQWSVRQGWRACLACSWAHKRIRVRDTEAFQLKSDLFYERIMKEEAA